MIIENPFYVLFKPDVIQVLQSSRKHPGYLPNVLTLTTAWKWGRGRAVSEPEWQSSITLEGDTFWSRRFSPEACGDWIDVSLCVDDKGEAGAGPDTDLTPGTAGHVLENLSYNVTLRILASYIVYPGYPLHFFLLQ